MKNKKDTILKKIHHLSDKLEFVDQFANAGKRNL